MEKQFVYGESIYSLAKDEGIEDKVLDELKGLSALFRENPDYVKILDSPRIDKKELMEILDTDFVSSVDRYTLNFVKVLSERHIVHTLDKCTEEYERLYNMDKNILVVIVTTAKPLNDDMTEKLAKKLEDKTGKRIILEKKTDKDIIGGIIIETDNVRIDKSLKNSLDEIKKILM